MQGEVCRKCVIQLSTLGREEDGFHGFLGVGKIVGTLFPVINPTDLLIDPVHPIINTSMVKVQSGPVWATPHPGTLQP